MEQRNQSYVLLQFSEKAMRKKIVRITNGKIREQSNYLIAGHI